MLRRLTSWLEARLGLGSLFSSWASHPLPGGSHWARTLGPVLVALFALEALTGLGLMAWYSPSQTGAWASVHYIQFQVWSGWLLRGLHHLAGEALVALALLHLLRALWWGAFRAPRELSWLAGLLMLQVLVVISHTGYLLPNDLRAYWATQVLLGIAGNQPVIGPYAQKVIQGGLGFGNTTLTHLYTAHVVLMPALVCLLGALYWLARRKHAAIAVPRSSEAEVAAKTQPYFPAQWLKDLFAIAAVFGVLLLVAVRNHGVELSAPADPAVEYVARPEWYFMPIFRLRHYFTGNLEFIATVVAPGLGAGFLMALPFLHARLAAKRPQVHRWLAGISTLGFVAAVALGCVSALEDARDEKAKEINLRADKWAKTTHLLAMQGVPVEGPTFLFQNDPALWGKRVFARDCAGCHSRCEAKPYEGTVCLEGYATRRWLSAFLRQPRAPHFFGQTKIDAMDPYDGTDDKLAALVEFLYGQSVRTDTDTAKAQHGEQLFESEGCGSCHTLDGAGTGDAPDLKGYASEEWLTAFIRDPAGTRFYGKLNEMDAFGFDKVTRDEVAAVVTFLRAQNDSQAKFLGSRDVTH